MMVEKRFHFVELRVGEILDVAGKPGAKCGEYVARAQHAHDGGDVLQRARRPDLRGEPPTCLVVALRAVERFLHTLDGTILERAAERFGLRIIVHRLRRRARYATRS